MLDVSLSQAGPIALDAKLQCAAGELLALVGPSGAGKSTILRAIAGLSRVRQARVSMDGELWQDSLTGQWTDPRQRRVGMVFQSYALFPHLSTLENVAEAVHDLPRPERHARALQALARVRLSGLEARLPSHLSGGQQQRVALARALVREPQVLLLDEPFAAVDQITRERLYEELAELRAGLRIPVILVTHSLVEAELLADRMVVLRRGKTLQSGAPAALLSRPATEEVAKLVGFGNIFEATVLAAAASPGGNPPPAGAVWVDLGGACMAVPEASGRTASQPGQRLRFGMATGDVVVLKNGRQPDEPCQCLEVVLARAVSLGENVRLTLRLSGSSSRPGDRAVGLSQTERHPYVRAVVTRRFFERSAMTEGAGLRLELPLAKLVTF